MPRFDAVLKKYREHTECNPSAQLESTVFARIENRGSDGFHALITRPEFRSAAMVAGLLIGMAAVAAPPSNVSATPSLPELAVFAPDAPHLPSTWLD